MSTNPPRVSVVLPNYNYEAYLDQRIGGLLSQTFSDFELIILDDASPDNSRSVIEKYASDPRVRLQFFEKNSGSTYQRWADGAKLARGEYLLFAGADDDCAPTMLERLCEKMDANPKIGIAYCQSQIIDENGNARGTALDFLEGEDFPAVDKARWQTDFSGDGREECRRFLVCQNTSPNASGALLRRSVYEAVGGLDLSLRLAADWLLWAQMLLRSDIAFVAEPLNFYRIHTRSVTSNTRKSGVEAEENYRVVREILSAVSVEPAVIEKVCASLLNNWMRPALHGAANIERAQHLKIYRIAKKVDAKLHRRIARRARQAARFRARKIVGPAR